MLLDERVDSSLINPDKGFIEQQSTIIAIVGGIDGAGDFRDRADGFQRNVPAIENRSYVVHGKAACRVIAHLSVSSFLSLSLSSLLFLSLF